MTLQELPPEVAHVLAQPALAARYVATRVLGQGGFGAVVAARDAELQRDVALKIMTGFDRDAAQRLVREGKLLARLNHPGIVRVYGSELIGGVPVLILELVQGRSLDGVLAEAGTFAVERAVKTVVELVEALAEAHREGIVHRDLKPQNVIVTPDGGLKLLDFGIARPIDIDPGSSAAITASGVITGTPTYFAPEQCQGAVADARGDLYAAGVVLFELLTGAPPYEGATPVDILIAHIKAPIPELSHVQGDVSPALAAVVRRALAKKPEERFSDAAAMIAALQRTLAEQRTPSRASPRAARPRSGRSSVDTVAAARVNRDAAATPPLRGRGAYVGLGAVVLALLGAAAMLRPPAAPPPSPSAEPVVASASMGASPAPSPAVPPATADRDPDPSLVVPHEVGGRHPSFVEGFTRSVVQLRTDVRSRLHLWSAPLSLSYKPTYIDKKVPDVSAIPAEAWKHEAESPGLALVHRLVVSWGPAGGARFLKVTATRDPAEPPKRAWHDRRPVDLPRDQVIRENALDVGLGELAPQQLARCDPLRDFGPTMGTYSQWFRHSILSYLSSLPDPRATAQLLQHLERILGHPVLFQEDLGPTVDALMFADPDNLERMWELLRIKDSRLNFNVAVNLSVAVSMHPRIAALLENEKPEVYNAGEVALRAVWLSLLPDRVARVRSMLRRPGYGAQYLPGLLAILDPEIDDLVLPLVKTDPAYRAQLLMPQSLLQLNLQAREPLVSYALDQAGLDAEQYQRLLAAAASCKNSPATVARVRRLAEAPGPVRAHALLALARTGQPLPSIDGLAPSSVAALAAGSDRRTNRTELLEAWARNSDVLPGARGAALLMLARMDRKAWSARRERLIAAAADRLAGCELQLSEVQRWCDFPPNPKDRDAIFLAAPGWSVVRTRQILGINPRLAFRGVWGWWEGPKPKLAAWTTLYSAWPSDVTSNFTLPTYGNWNSMLALGIAPEEKLPGADQGLQWMVVAD